MSPRIAKRLHDHPKRELCLLRVGAGEGARANSSIASDQYYLPYTKCPRRFCCQQASFDSLQNGFSLP